MALPPAPFELMDTHEIAAYLGIVPASVRKLASMARQGIGSHPFPHPADANKPDRWYAWRVRAWAAARPGRGAPGKARRKRAA